VNKKIIPGILSLSFSPQFIFTCSTIPISIDIVRYCQILINFSNRAKFKLDILKRRFMKKTGFMNALYTLIYIVLVAMIMQNGEKIFGKMSNYVGPVAFLLLFTLSALIVGTLILGKPLMLYLNNKKKEAVFLFSQITT